MARSDFARRRLVAALAGVWLVSAMVACNGIVGLSDYGRAECSGGGLCSDAGVIEPDARPDDSGSDGAVELPGTGPIRWPHFPMPNYVVDGGPVDNPASYETSSRGTVFDKVTKLTWREPMTDTAAKSWDEAQAVCASITDGGKWRLPSRIELVTLLDLTTSPTIDRRFFKSTQSFHYWTSSEVRPYGKDGVRERWTVNFDSGGVGKQSEASGKAAVRCIKDKE